MKLISFSFQDLNNGWTLEEINFKKLSLLVGASGVGKTKILKSLSKVHSFALGKDLTNAKWKLVFEIDGCKYIWQGIYKAPENSLNDLFENKFINNATLSNDLDTRVQQTETLEKINEEDDITLIFKRTNDIIQFKNQFDLPKLSGEKSCIELFSNETDIALIINEFSKIFFFDFEDERRWEVPTMNFGSKSKKLSTNSLNFIKNARVPISLKIALMYEHFPDIFDEIKFEYMGIFPTVTDIRFKKISSKNKNGENKFAMDLEIQENGKTWIGRNDISSGMLKTFLYLSLFYLSPVNSIIINDEFENSLGINCIDIIKEAMVFGPPKQIISTSHHPYIINNIKMENWIIVSRKGNKVHCGNAIDYKLGNSKHDAFKQLINNDRYRKGGGYNA